MGTRNTFTQTSSYGNGVTATSSSDVIDENADRGAVYNTAVDSLRAEVTAAAARIFTEFVISGDVAARDMKIAKIREALKA